jgi:hypothetical protein
MTCGYLTKKSSRVGFGSEVQARFVSEKLRLEEDTPSPHALKGLIGAAFAKSVCKILRAKALEVRI